MFAYFYQHSTVNNVCMACEICTLLKKPLWYNYVSDYNTSNIINKKYAFVHQSKRKYFIMNLLNVICTYKFNRITKSIYLNALQRNDIGCIEPS